MRNDLNKGQKKLTETIFSPNQKIYLEEKILNIFHSSKDTL